MIYNLAPFGVESFDNNYQRYDKTRCEEDMMSDTIMTHLHFTFNGNQNKFSVSSQSLSQSLVTILLSKHKVCECFFPTIP